MQTSFHASDSGQACIENVTAVGTEQLVMNLHPGQDSSIEVQIREDVPGEGVITSSITVHRAGLQQLVQWLRDQGALD